MKGFGIGLTALVIGLIGTVGLGVALERRSVDEMAEAANSLLASFSASQRAQATFDFDSDERSRHHFIPPETFERHGAVLKEMTSEQKVRALDLLRSGLSEQGYMTAQQIMEVEGILGVIVEGADRQFDRNQEDYWVSVFGTPSTGSTWGWRWERASPVPALHSRGGGDHDQHAYLPGRKPCNGSGRAEKRPARDERAGGYGPRPPGIAGRETTGYRDL